MEPFSLKKEEYFVIKKWADRFPNIMAGFTTKNGGFSRNQYETLNAGLHVNDSYEAVSQNRQHVADLLGFSIENWVGAEQTHDVNIKKLLKMIKEKVLLFMRIPFQVPTAFSHILKMS